MDGCSEQKTIKMRKRIQIEILNNLEALTRKERPKELATPRLASAGGCDQCTKRNREELPHVRGQGQKPEGPHARRAMAKRSYPTSKVRGSCRECQAAMAQERPRRATQVRGQGRQPRGATPRLRLRVAAEEDQPHVQGAVAAQAQEGLEELSHIEGQKGRQ